MPLKKHISRDKSVPPERFWSACAQAVGQEGTAGMILLVLAVGILALLTWPRGPGRWGT